MKINQETRVRAWIEIASAVAGGLQSLPGEDAVRFEGVISIAADTADALLAKMIETFEDT